MNLFDWLFGKSVKQNSMVVKENSAHSEVQKDIEIEGSISGLNVPSGILNQIIDYDENEIIEHIQSKRKLNLQKHDENFEKAMAHLDKGNYSAANRLTSKDVIGFYDYYLLAQAEEKNENISRAAEIYWFNIYHNGTDAPANFDRLMILFRKMNDFQKEYKVAKIYRTFVNESYHDEIDKRIETITKKMKK